MTSPRRWLGVLALACTTHAHAQAWSYTRIATNSTIVPGTTAPFQIFGLPSIDNGVVGLTGSRINGQPFTAGVYIGSGGPLTTIADHFTPIPSGTGNFIGFGAESNPWPQLNAGVVAFRGNGSGTSFIQQGIYIRSGSTLTRVIDRNTPAPNGSGGNFFAIGQPSLENGRVAFVGYEFGDAQKGVYSWQSGPLSIIADKSTPIPGGSGTFTTFGEASLDSGQVLFQASGTGEYRGLFLANETGAITRLYDTNTPIPGTSGTFTFLSQSALSAGRVAFSGQGPVDGVYSDVGGNLDVIADQNTPVPGLSGTFASFGYVRSTTASSPSPAFTRAGWASSPLMAERSRRSSRWEIISMAASSPRPS